MDGATPGMIVNDKCRPLAEVNVEGTEGLLELLFITFLWCSSITMTGEGFLDR